MNSSFVGEGAETSDGVVEGNRDLDGIRHEVLELSEHGKVVLGFDVLGVDDVHSGDQSSESLHGGEGISMRPRRKMGENGR